MNLWTLALSSAVLTGALAAEAQTAPAGVNVLLLSDIHLDSTAQATTYQTDTGQVLWTAAKAKAQAVVAATAPSFVVVLGDLPAHKDQGRSDNIAAAFRDLRTTFGPQLPVLYLPGNNDSIAGNYHSFSLANGVNALSLDPGGSWPVLNGAASCGAPSDAACILDRPSNLSFGYYSAYPLGEKGRLRFLGLNTVMFVSGYVSSDNVSQQDAVTMEMDWLTAQLADAQVHGESVIIGMHVPPGLSFDGTPMWDGPVTVHGATIADTFLTLINRYQDTVKLVLSSHTHFDELRLLADAPKHLTVVGMSAPSVSPIHGNNPSMKVLSLDAQTYVPLAATTYYTTPSATTWGDSLYVMRDDYGCVGAQTLFDCFSSANEATLEAAMNSEYSGHYVNSSLDYSSVDAMIWVEPSAARH